MSFDPKYDPTDDPNFDGQLPDDFAALGEQLHADAQRLSSVYPACQPPTRLLAALASEPQPWWLQRRVQAGVSAAAVLLLASGLTLLVMSRGGEQTAQPAANPTPENSVVVVPTDTEEVAELTPVSFRPAVIDVNGPELEGLLDLWQEQSPAAGSISF